MDDDRQFMGYSVGFFYFFALHGLNAGRHGQGGVLFSPSFLVGCAGTAIQAAGRGGGLRGSTVMVQYAKHVLLLLVLCSTMQ